MTDKEYYDWFVERAEKFAEIGIMHPNSDWGKLARIALLVSEERFKQLEEKISILESQLPKKRRKKNEG